MSRAIALLIMVPLLAANPIHAQIDPRPNSIGIYFDTAGTVNCLTAVPGDVVTAHVLVTRLDPASEGISGFEMSLVYDQADFPLGLDITLPPTAINVLSPPMFQVGFGVPLPCATAIEIMTLTIPYAGGSVLLGIGWTDPCSFGGDPCLAVAAANNPGVLIYLAQSSNVPVPGRPHAYFVAGINAGPGCPVAVELGSWSGVKGLYR